MNYPKLSFTRSLCISISVISLVLFSSVSYANAAGQWRDGMHVYEKVCSYCHDIGVGPVLKSTEKPVEYIQYIVRNGFRAMPAFRASEINDAELKLLADFIKSAPPN